MRALACSLAIVAFCSQSAGSASRLKDITEVQGVRENLLVGYGLVIGLSGSGDSTRNAPFTEQSMRSMLQRLGVGVPAGSVRSRNAAAVVVTARLPPFVAKGERIDVTVSSLGDATSLSGGTLVLTPLSAADGRAYAVAQGTVSITGFSASGQAETLSQGVPTGGRIANGALIEREMAASFNGVAEISLKIRNPDFATAAAIADVINTFAIKNYGGPIAGELDLRTVRIKRPEKVTASRLLAQIGGLRVDTSTPARIVIDEKTGTIVVGSDVRISPVAVAHGNITIRVTETPTVIQPEPFTNGEVAVEPSTAVAAELQDSQVAVLEGPSLERLVHGLNRLGLKPSGIIAILQAIKTAGALQADLVIQ
jgi:flagellar P-ring protein precursor FlgI